ncbi:glycosyltransferase family 2 protein [Ectothiorhodospira marina]|uniref:Glycosyl transferase family 2 n=1 Tax=Ectothiorhodospira marina TaxID=1396821 RepID=A0A1H7IDC2_9GAMM|nr:glycosyltransferase [Ectothiorhodospira marina]SEK59842.1 Glycosyl transferase family 2 [Ectothiorhodospira marina]
MDNLAKPFFSVVIPTRNRPKLFALALRSVLEQSFREIEIIVVMDGSDPQHDPEYAVVLAEAPNACTHRQPHRPNGHGQSYSMNTGAYIAQGDYVAFLDDDDYWTDPQHLARAHTAIQASQQEVDAYYSDQRAYFADGSETARTVWIEDLASQVVTQGQAYGDAYRVSPEFLLSSKGFAHLNCSIIRRELYLQLSGMDENIRYECDRDFFLRTLDAAENFLYCPLFTSRHHIPEKGRRDNMSTLVSDYQKALYQIAVYEKNQLLSRRPAIRNACRVGLSYVYKNLAEQLARERRLDDALRYAQKALALDGGWKWRARTLLLWADHRFRRPRHSA